MDIQRERQIELGICRERDRERQRAATGYRDMLRETERGRDPVRPRERETP